MSTRNYSNTAVVTALSSSIDTTTTQIRVDATDGYPAAPFTIIVSPDTVAEEIMLVTAATGNDLTVTRGFDSTAASPHGAGAVVKHGAVALDFREANAITSGGSGVKTWSWLAEKP